MALRYQISVCQRPPWLPQLQTDDHCWRTHLSLAMDNPESLLVQFPTQGTVVE